MIYNLKLYNLSFILFNEFFIETGIALEMDSRVIEELHKQCSLNILLFRALGDQERLDILANIIKSGLKGLSVNEITALSHLSRPAISHHLKSMKDCNIVESIKIGTKVYYRINTRDHIDRLRQLVAGIQQFINALPPEYREN